MGQTLSHGVYLPAEGERNCYSGLASNWNLLDTAIGDIDGKASATHTHGNISNDGKVGTTANKPLITGTGGAVQAGAFGNQANTFCEGNDSRLSDARTPVAHTHVTSEVLKTGSARTASPQTNFYFKIASWEMGANQYFGAELLVQNSNYTQNRVNITIGVRTSSSYTFAAGYLYLSNVLGFDVDQFYICYKEESNKVLFELYHYMPSTWNGIKFSVISECLNKSSFVIELFNTMTVYNRISSDAVADLPTGYTAIEAKYLPLSQDINPASNNTYNFGTSSYQWNNLYAKNYFYNGTQWGLDQNNTWTGNNKFTDLTISSINTIDITQSTLASATISANLPFKDNGNRYWGAIRTQSQTDRSNILKFTVSNWKTNGTQGTTDLCFSYDANLDKKAFYPTSTNTELGTSTNRWKTLNGVNPGALSLPDTTREEPIDTTNWVYSYTAPNVYYPPEDGWLAIACSGSDYIQVDGNTGWGITLSKGYDGYCTGIIPVKKNVRVQIRIKETSSGSVVVRKASFYPGTGDPSFTVTPLNNS